MCACVNTQSENTDLEEQLKWLKRESEEAKVASEVNIKEVLTIAEDLRTKKAEQEATISELTRLVIGTTIYNIILLFHVQ